MNALVTRITIALLAGLAGSISAPLIHAQTDGGAKEVTSPGHTTDMPGREGHSSDHMKGKKTSKGKPVKSETGHTVNMPGREGHKTAPNDPAGSPVSSPGHTTDMPGREGHSGSHDKK